MPHAAGLPGRAGGEHEPPHGVGAVLVHERDRLEHVAEVLAHLAAILVEDVAEADDVLVGAVVEDQGADRHQRVEPAAGLIDRLADEVGGVARVECLAPSMGVAPLREWHGTGVVPAVDDFGDACGGAAALGAGKGDVVDEGAVRVECRQVAPGPLAEFGQ